MEKQSGGKFWETAVVIFGLIAWARFGVWEMFAVVVGGTLLLNALTFVRRTNYGLRYWRGEFREDVEPFNEGLHLIWPFLETVRQYPYKTEKRDVKVSVQSDEGDDDTSLEIIIEGHFEFYPDRRLFGQYRKESEESITAGVTNAVKEELGIIAGTVRSFDFVRSREEIVLIINAMLRLARMPHLCPGDYGCANPALITDGEVPPEKRLEFYKKHRTDIRRAIEHEEQDAESFSPIETRYGINIRSFSLADADFSDEVKKALESKKRTEGQVKGMQVLAEKQLALQKKWREEGGLDPADAAVMARVATGTPNKIITVQGAHPLVGAISDLFDRSSGESPSPKKKDGKKKED